MTFLPKRLLLSRREQAIFLFLAVLALYYPAISGCVVSIDDVAILKHFGSGRVHLRDVFRPDGGYYYRPLANLSYFLDSSLLGQNSALMHLENILLHAANTLLLFLLAGRLVPAAARFLPLGAALIFGVHPVNAEAVNWIAGRTDPLAAFFVLISALLLCRALETGRLRYSVGSVALLIVGAFAKETALVFIPCSLLLVGAWPHLNPEVSRESVRRQLKVLAFLYLLLALAIVLLLAYRSGFRHNSLEMILTGNKEGALGTLAFCLKVVGFYLKKMLLPWPLNFAITKVATWYLVPALLAFGLLLVLPRRDTWSLFVWMGLLFLAPAVVVGLYGVAWTVAAERYLYLPSAFFSLALAGYLKLAAQQLGPPRIFVPLIALCLALTAASTVRRTLVWQSNLALFQDAVAQSPELGMLHNELAVALIQAERIPEAQRQLDIAASLEISDRVKGLVRKNRILIGLRRTSPEETRRILNATGRSWQNEEADLLVILRQNDYKILRELKEGPERDGLVSELIGVSEALYARTRDPLLLYNNGQLFLSRGDRVSAVSCFTRCYRAAADEAPYKAPARKLVADLAGVRL